MEVLNPGLYVRLRRQFGTVKVRNEGEAFVCRTVRGLNGKPEHVIGHSGEYYLANCAFCHDTRYRLYVNHMFGKKDEFGCKMNFLAICYNEACLARPQNLRRFVERLDSLGGPIGELRIMPGKLVSNEAQEVLLPGPCLAVNRLPAEHKACDYLVNTRAFDLDYVGKCFGVSYCEDSRYFLAADRLIIPVYENKRLKGWQARYIGELAWKDHELKAELPPKYFSCPGAKFRSRCVYNFDAMKHWHTGIICEGPTDVWRVGAMAGCVFGNTVTQLQRAKLLATFKSRALILLLDPEEFDSKATQKTIEWFMMRMPGNFCAIKLPDGFDPGKLDRAFVREFVKEEAARLGVQVQYRRLAKQAV